MTVAKLRTVKMPRYALSFDGVDDYVDCGNPPSLSPTEAITLMAWIKREEVNDYGMVIGKGSSYLLGYYNNNRIFFNFYNGTSWLTNIYSNTVITHQEWHHIAATYDKNQAKVKIYINGELDKEASVTPYNIYQSTYSVYIGYMQGWAQHWHLQGKIALAAIFNRALTDEEIADMYNNKIPTDGIVLLLEANPDYIKDIDNDGILELIDLSGNGNHGKIYGATLVEHLIVPKRPAQPPLRVSTAVR